MTVRLAATVFWVFLLAGEAGGSSKLLAGTDTVMWPASPAPGPVNVVLVHGILDTGHRFDALRRVLENDGCRCLAPSLRPNNGCSGVRDLSVKLAAAIDARFGRTAPFFIIGFSLGGLVTRDYVQNVAADRRRVRGVFLISTPNHGTIWAGTSPDPHLRELAPGSAFLTALNADESVWARIPVCSYWTPLDLMIVPATSSLWPIGGRKMVFCLLHPLMTRNQAVMADIRARICVMSAPCAFTRNP